MVVLVPMHYTGNSRLSRQPLPDFPRPDGRLPLSSGLPRCLTKGCAAMVPEPRSPDHELTTGRIDVGGHLSLRVTRPTPRTVLVEVTGEIDLNTARSLDEVLRDRIRGPVGEVVIALAGVTFFSVAGLNSLLRAQLLADAAGARLTVDPGGSRAVKRLFTLLPMDFYGVMSSPPAG